MAQIDRPSTPSTFLPDCHFFGPSGIPFACNKTLKGKDFRRTTRRDCHFATYITPLANHLAVSFRLLVGRCRVSRGCLLVAPGASCWPAVG